jgi:hypothetical protein
VEVFAEYFEILVEGGDVLVIGVTVVYSQAATNVDAEDRIFAAFEEFCEFIYAVAEGNEVNHVEYLRTDVEMDTYKLDVG